MNHHGESSSSPLTSTLKPQLELYEQLEEQWAGYLGLEPECVVGCSSGTAALHLALECLQLEPGSQVIIPDFAMIACARACTLAGLVPVFADCKPNLLLDMRAVSDLVTKRVKAIMPVHIYGRRCDMNPIHHLAKDAELCVVEDLAEAHNIPPHPESDAACYSFYKNKLVAGEEGGAIAFHPRRDLAYRPTLARQLRTLGFTEDHDYDHVPRGHNYRLSNVHAGMILASLKRIDMNMAARRQLEEAYQEECPPEWRMPLRECPWVYDLRIKGMTAEMQTMVVHALNGAGLPARHGFKPLSRQQEYAQTDVRLQRRTMHSQKVKETEAQIASREVIYLPLTPGKFTHDPATTASLAFDVIFATLQRLVEPYSDLP